MFNAVQKPDVQEALAAALEKAAGAPVPFMYEQAGRQAVGVSANAQVAPASQAVTTAQGAQQAQPEDGTRQQQRSEAEPRQQQSRNLGGSLNSRVRKLCRNSSLKSPLAWTPSPPLGLSSNLSRSRFLRATCLLMRRSRMKRSRTRRFHTKSSTGRSPRRAIPRSPSRHHGMARRMMFPQHLRLVSRTFRQTVRSSKIRQMLRRCCRPVSAAESSSAKSATTTCNGTRLNNGDGGCCFHSKWAMGR